MKMTENIRRQIIVAVMADVPEVDYAVQMRDAATKAAVALLPPEVRKLWDNPELRPWVRMVSAYCDCMSFALPATKVAGDAWRSDHEAMKDPEFVRLHKLHDEQRDTRIATKEKLTTALKTFTTTQKFVEDFPDLAKYVPGEAAKATNALVSTEVMDSLKKAGLKIDNA